MTVEFESTNMVTMSPRISFSHDISQMETIPVEQRIRSSSSSSSVDFDFCVFRESFDHDQSSSADDIFSGGKILPIEIKRRLLPPPSKQRKEQPPPPRRQYCTNTNEIRLLGPAMPTEQAFPPFVPPPQQEITSQKANLSETKRVDTEPDEKQNSSKSFWGFKRSSSCHFGSGYARTLCPIPRLSKSNSTGSSTNAKKSSATCNNHDQLVGNKDSNCSLKEHHHQRHPMKKQYGQGLKFKPVLNVPTSSLFGLASMFSSSKDKNKKN